MNNKLIVLIKVMCICFLGNGAYGKSQIKEWEEKACSDLYGSIGLFTHLSDEKWKEKNMDKRKLEKNSNLVNVKLNK